MTDHLKPSPHFEMPPVMYELCRATGYRPDRNTPIIRREIASRVNRLSQDAWDQLSEKAQNWFNRAAKAIAEEKHLPTFAEGSMGDKPPPKPARGKKVETIIAAVEYCDLSFQDWLEVAYDRGVVFNDISKAQGAKSNIKTFLVALDMAGCLNDKGKAVLKSKLFFRTTAPKWENKPPHDYMRRSETKNLKKKKGNK